MIAASRPLRFVVLVIGGWIAARVALHWPGGMAPEAIAPAVSARFAARLADPPPHPPPPPSRATAPAQPAPRTASVATTRPPPPAAPILHPAEGRAADYPAAGHRPEPLPDFAAPIAAAPLPVTGERPRLSVSAWLMLRGGGGGSSPFAPQLGGSQAGVRIAHARGRSRRFALTAGVAAAPGARQRQAAIGVDWQLGALPVHLILEQRFALDGGRGGPVIGVIGGLAPTRIAPGLTLEAYGQAGAIGRDGGEGFVDGAARLMHRLKDADADADTAPIALGIGLWGGAQRAAARLDIGPAASVTIGARRALRVSLEWRQRIAGAAQPGAGPALSLGSDF